MRPKWLNWLLGLGAVMIAGGGIAWLCLFAAPLLLPTATSNESRGNVITLTSPQSSGASWGWVETDRQIDPATEDTVVLQFWVTSTDPTQASYVLSGPMLKYLHTCYGNAMHYDPKPVNSGLLSEVQYDAATTYWSFSPAQGVLDLSAANEVMSSAEAKLNVKSQSYIRITSNSSTSDPRSYTNSAGVPQTTKSRYYSFRCSFAPAAFWADANGERTFSSPAIIYRYNEGSSFGFLSHTVAFVRNSAYSLTALGDKPDYSKSGETSFSASGTVTDRVGPGAVELGQVVAIFKKTSANDDRQIMFLFVGAVVAFLASILLSLAKKISDGFATVLAGRFSRRDEAEDS